MEKDEMFGIAWDMFWQLEELSQLRCMTAI